MRGGGINGGQVPVREKDRVGVKARESGMLEIWICGCGYP